MRSGSRYTLIILAAWLAAAAHGILPSHDEPVRTIFLIRHGEVEANVERRYIGLGGRTPDLAKLGSGAWKKARQAAETSILDYAARAGRMSDNERRRMLRAFDAPGRERMKPAELACRAEKWRPWRAYAALLLWGSAPAAGD